MRTLRFIGVMVIGLAALLGATPVSPAHATPPTIERMVINQTVPAGGLTGACGFPVQRHDDYVIIVHTYTDSSGNTVRELDNSHGTVTYIANGHSAVGHIGGVAMFLPHPDGSLTVRFSGPDRFIVVPGAGPVRGATGHYTYEFAPDGTLISSTAAGLIADNVAALCAALAP